ncbi:uncharacterized protein Bfra_007060 [Botrytis fragariae]|uniref:F-box domain-containing protein n=1 Tax=Botrytis fragariae TaxID=1964551 RepID=A0A8H6AIC9_9HELO|nr:uncharacterized protein Bfra_007060 [Botrytis fragariae]KAF5867865.1 hypothetical protein Bfra_007060 [Botrytis fragariae]
MIKFEKFNKKVIKALPHNLVSHDEEADALPCMTLSEKWAFKSILNQEKITLSTKLNVQGKAKPKTQLETPINNSRITRLPQEILLRIANNLDFHGNQNIVPLALTCRHFYLLFCNDIKRVDLRQLICPCTNNDLPQFDMDHDHMPKCRPCPLWSCIEDWSGLGGYLYCSGRHNYCCPGQSKLKECYWLSRDRGYLPWPIETRGQTIIRIKNQEEAARSLCHALSVGLFIKVSALCDVKADFFIGRAKTSHYAVPSLKSILCELDRQARHCWGKEMMLNYSEWREMIGF